MKYGLIEHCDSIKATDLVRQLSKQSNNKLVKDDGYYAEYDFTPINTQFSTPKSYKVLLDSTTPNFGGYRYWLVCERCHRKVTALYIYNNQLACRHCHHLEYGSRMFAHNTPMLDMVRYQRGMETVGRLHTYGDRTTRAGRRFQRYMGELLDKYPVESLIRI